MLRTPKGTTPPTTQPPHQSKRHSATHTTRSPPLTTGQRYPHDTSPSNPHSTATRRQAIRTAQRHKTHPTPSATHQSLWHSDTRLSPDDPATRQSERQSAQHTPRPSPIPTAQRHKFPPRRPRSRSILRAQRIGHTATVRVRSATVNKHIPKTETNTVQPPRPPLKNKNPSLRIREKLGRKKTGAFVASVTCASASRPAKRSVPSSVA